MAKHCCIACGLLVALGEICFSAESDVESPASAVTIDKTRLCVTVDGKPFFPIGCCGIPPEYMKECAEAGFNLTIRWAPPSTFGKDFEAALAKGDEEAQEYLHDYLDAAHRAGLRVIEYPILFAFNDIDKTHPSLQGNFTKFLKKPLPEVVSLVKDHPALLAYYGPDEPGLALKFGADRDLWRRQLQQFTDVIHRADPSHPVYFLFDNGGDDTRTVRGWVESYDLLGHDVYPGGCLMPLLRVSREVAEYVSFAHQNGRPYWHMPLMEVCALSRERPIRPYAQRMQSYLAIIGGANGIIWWEWPPRNIENWNTVKELAGEMRALSPVLTEPPAATNVQWSPPYLRNTIRVRAIRHEGHTWLIAVNAAAFAADVRFELPVALRERAKVWFEDREIKISGRHLPDRFEAYDRHVYEIPAEWPQQREIQVHVKLGPPADDPEQYFPPVASGANLLHDPGFEHGRGWSFSAPGSTVRQSQGGFDTRSRHGGKRAAVINCIGEQNEVTWTGAELTLKPNTLYLFGGWVKPMVIGDAKVGVYLRTMVGKTPSRLGGYTGTLFAMDSTPWRQYWKVFRTGDRPARVQPVCSVALGKRSVAGSPMQGKVWFDDLFLVEGPRDVSNMVLNGGFEGPEVSPGWPQQWGGLYGNSLAVPGARGTDNPLWGTDGSMAHQGRKSLRLVKPTSIDDPDHRPGACYAFPPGTRLIQDKRYVLSVFMKSGKSDASVGIFAGGWGIADTTVTVSDEWKRYIVAVRPERDQESPFLGFVLKTEGRLWIDAVQFEEGTEPTEYNEWELVRQDEQSQGQAATATGVAEPQTRRRMRTWTDASGDFKIEAAFVGYANGVVKLKKKNGATLQVPFERLSKQDQKWVESQR